MKIALDLDGTTRDFVGRLIEVYKEDYPDHEVKPVTTWMFHESFPIGEDIYDYYKDNADRIFGQAFPYVGAKEFVESLKKLGHQVIIVTTQPESGIIPTVRWIEMYLPKVDGIMFTKHKSLVDFDALLDDAPHNIEEAKKAGKVSLFYNQPWNEGIEHPRVYSYDEFLGLLVDLQDVIDSMKTEETI